MDNEPRFTEIYFDEIIRETDMAYLLAIDDEEVWLPKSQCKMTETRVAELPEWLAIEKGLV